ncbi:hypothetical protein CsSME_00023589 [Camellia sinensis var. sinensis]
MRESFSDNYKSMRREKYNNKNLEEIHSFNGVLSSEKINFVMGIEVGSAVAREGGYGLEEVVEAKEGLRIVSEGDIGLFGLGMAMGRDVTGIRIDKKPNLVKVNSNGVSHDPVHVSPKTSEVSDEAKDYEAEDHTAHDSLVEESHEKQDVLGVKSTNRDAGLPEGKTLKPEAQKSSDKKLNSPVQGHVETKDTVSQPSTPAATEKPVSTETDHVGPETVDAGRNCSPNTNDFHSPGSSRKSQASQLILLCKDAIISFLLFKL